MNKKILIAFMLGMFLLILVSATETSVGSAKQGDCLTLVQTDGNSTYFNITSITYPNKSIENVNYNMSSDGLGTFTYNYCNTNNLGNYNYNTCGNPNGIYTCYPVSFTITPNGSILTTGESILYLVFIVILFGVLMALTYFILILPGENERDEGGTIIGVVRLKYLKVVLIAVAYPLLILILNLLNGLAVNYTNLTIFAGIIGFLFEMLLRGAWIFTLLLIIWIVYMLIHDTNINRELKKARRFRL